SRFYVQGEHGIRDSSVTGVQTCALPIWVLRVCWLGSWALGTSDRGGQDKSRKVRPVGRLEDGSNFSHAPNIANIQRNLPFLIARSEERRVGIECMSRWATC